MSDLSVFEGAVVTFFKTLVSNASPATQTAVQPVVTNLQNAETDAVAALPALAADGVNLVMGMLGPVGAAAEPLADAFIDAVVTQLTAKKSAAAPAAGAG